MYRGFDPPDKNTKEIVLALRAVGATVYHIKRPVDIMVGYHRTTYLMEIKNRKTRYGKKGLSKAQREFSESWRGGRVWEVSSVSEALSVVGVAVLAA